MSNHDSENLIISLFLFNPDFYQMTRITSIGAMVTDC